MEGIYSSAEETAEGQCRSRKREYNKDKILCCGCGEYFLFIDLYDYVIRWWHRPADSEVF